MGINEIGNIIYLKELTQTGPNEKKSVEKKERSIPDKAEPQARRNERAEEVERQNILASSPSIRDFEEAVQVMKQLNRLAADKEQTLLAAHSAKPVDLSAI